LFKLSILFNFYGKFSNNSSLKIGLSLIIVGILMLVSGGIFHFQGQGVIGPESSFMYSNPDWISYGQQIVIVGLIIVGAGIWLILSKSARL